MWETRGRLESNPQSGGKKVALVTTGRRAELTRQYDDDEGEIKFVINYIHLVSNGYKDKR